MGRARGGKSGTCRAGRAATGRALPSRRGGQGTCRQLLDGFLARRVVGELLLVGGHDLEHPLCVEASRLELALRLALLALQALQLLALLGQLLLLRGGSLLAVADAA